MATMDSRVLELCVKKVFNCFQVGTFVIFEVNFPIPLKDSERALLSKCVPEMGPM